MKSPLVNLDFASLELRVTAQAFNTRARRAILARAYGAGEIKVALLLGRYPVPHDALDMFELDRIEQTIRQQSKGWAL